MPIPGQTITIRDPGLGLTAPAGTLPAFIGNCSAGSFDTPTRINSISQLTDTFGVGPTPNAAAHYLKIVGGPIIVIRTNTSVAASVTAAAHQDANGGPGAGPLAAVSGTPADQYVIRLQITGAGDLGVGRFQYTLADTLFVGGADQLGTMSAERTIPAGGVFAIPNTGLTITFPVGSYIVGEIYITFAVPEAFNAADLNTAITALLATSEAPDFFVFVDVNQSAAAAATLFAAISGHMTQMQNAFRWPRAMHPALTATVGETAADLISAYGDSDLVSAVAVNTLTRINALPYEGFGVTITSGVEVAAAQDGRTALSTDLKRVLSGSLPDVLAIGWDEALNNQGLDDAGFLTFRTHIGRNGFFITQGRLKAPPGSDFQFWQLGRIMDVALRATFLVQQTFIGVGVRTVSSPVGAIDDRDAARLETRVDRELRIKLTQPQNDDGFPGHVQDVQYIIDRTNNVLSSQTIQATLNIKPLGYVSFITLDAGFVLVTVEPEEEAA